MTTFSGERFNEVWRGLDDDTRTRIKAKANWEHISLSAVMEGYWPELWARIAAKRCSFCGTTEDLTVGTGGINACADCRAEADW